MVSRGRLLLDTLWHLPRTSESHCVSGGRSQRITFIVEGNTVRIVNSAVYAMHVLQKEMVGEAERADLSSDDDVMALVKKTRSQEPAT